MKAYLTPCAQPDKEGLDYGDRSKPELEILMAKRQPDLEKYRIAKCYLVKYGTGGVEAGAYIKVVDSYETIPARK